MDIGALILGALNCRVFQLNLSGRMSGFWAYPTSSELAESMS